MSALTRTPLSFSLRALLLASVLLGVLFAQRPDPAAAAGFNCWVRGAYLYNSMNYGHRSVCTDPHRAVVTLKRSGGWYHEYSSTLNMSPAASNWINTAIGAVPMTCFDTYQVLVQAYRLSDGAYQYWTSGVPRRMC